MPIYSITARDFPDAPGRRAATRARHVELCDRMVETGNFLFGGAIIEDGQLRGSVLIVEFADRAGLDAWLSGEPYIEEKVWQSCSPRGKPICCRSDISMWCSRCPPRSPTSLSTTRRRSTTCCSGHRRTR